MVITTTRNVTGKNTIENERQFEEHHGPLGKSGHAFDESIVGKRPLTLR